MKIPRVEATILELMNLYAHFVDMAPRRVLRFFFPEKIRPEDYYWSEVLFFQPKVRLSDGTWSGNGRMWRRRRESDDRWEYQQDPETAEEAMDRVI
jgi:hypothetical protein